MKVFQNIRVRLTLWYLLVVAVLILFFGGVAYILLSDSLSRKSIDPWDMQIADIELSDGYRVTGLSDVTLQMGLGLSPGNFSVRGLPALNS